jgi:exonuclease VII small subunit
MALSQKVKDSLDEAQSHIRIALSYASKNEKPIVNKQIAEIMCLIQNVMKFEEMSDKLEEMVDKMKKDGNGFFGF